MIKNQGKTLLFQKIIGFSMHLSYAGRIVLMSLKKFYPPSLFSFKIQEMYVNNGALDKVLLESV